MMKLKSMAAATVVLAALGFATAAHAQNSLTSEYDVIPNFNIDQIEAVLTGEGVPHQRGQKSNGGVFLSATYNGYTIVLDPYACSQDTCKGVRILAIFTDIDATLTEINEFHSRFFPATVYTQGSDIVFQRYLIGDYGYTRGTFIVNLAVLAAMPEVFVEFQNSNGATQVSYQSLLNAPVAPQNVKPGKEMPGDKLADDLNSLQKIANREDASLAPQPAPAKFSASALGEPLDISEYPAELFNHAHGLEQNVSGNGSTDEAAAGCTKTSGIQICTRSAITADQFQQESLSKSVFSSAD